MTKIQITISEQKARDIYNYFNNIVRALKFVGFPQLLNDPISELHLNQMEEITGIKIERI